MINQSLTNKYRPQSFKELRGQDFPKMVLQKVVESPEGFTRSLILAGSFGTGKTSISRIFAKALNCESKTGDACNVCDSCIDITRGSNLYQELDSSIVGNVETMKDIRDVLSYGVSNGYKVVAFDECHVITKQAFTALLKVLEEASSKIFFLFPTTNVEKMLDTIKSRSLILTFQELTDSEVSEHLRFICTQESVDLPQDIEDFIIRRSKGHVRDSLQQLQLFFKLSAEDYRKQCFLLDREIFNLIKYSHTNKMDEAKQSITKILKYPVHHIQQDFEEVIKKISNSIYILHHDGKNVLPDRKLYQRIIQYYFENSINIVDTNHWFIFLSSLITVIREPEFFNFS